MNRPFGILRPVPESKKQEVQVFRASCYICTDPDFRDYGLPICYACPKCGGHIAADDTICDDCGYEEPESPGDSPSQGVRCPHCNSWTWAGFPTCRNCDKEVS